jgi:carbamoyl-phosphate synthase/aspartate carbamoyltransferase/dihydroorotase
LDAEWKIEEKNLFTKCKWSPFIGRTMRGAVSRVVLRNEVAYVDGQVLVNPGYGMDMREVQIRQSVQVIFH